VSRYLFVVPPLVGHINPAVGLAAELTARGHQVAWAGMPELLRSLAGRAAEIYPCALPVGRGRDAVERPPGLCGAAALQCLWADFLIPLSEAMAPGVLAAVEHFRPDVLVVDQQAVAGALVAERLGIPWVTSATTSAELTGGRDTRSLVDAWVSERFDDLRARTGAAPGGDPRFSPHLIIAFTTAELTGPVLTRPGPVCFVGPTTGTRPGVPDFPWDWRDPERRLVLVSVGLANRAATTSFLTVARRALVERADRLQGIIVDHGEVLDSPAPTPSVLVLPVVPQRELLPWCSALVCHAGHNAVCDALWHGVPLVLAPIGDDQPVVANQVVAAGAGVRVRFGRVTAGRLGEALDLVLDDPLYRKAAEYIGDSLRASGGAAAAARCIEALR
jgi:UDP:flavonoid glycosyltransferase YjiC (YdhE family)